MRGTRREQRRLVRKMPVYRKPLDTGSNRDRTDGRLRRTDFPVERHNGLHNTATSVSLLLRSLLLLISPRHSVNIVVHSTLAKRRNLP